MGSNFKDSGEVKIKDLPVYAEKAPLNTYSFVESEKLPLQQELATVRYAAQDFYTVFADRFKLVDKTMKKCKNTVQATDEYLRNEWTVLPKAAAITVGGLAGFVLGLRHYGIRKYIYAGTGLLTMAAFCYPNEAIEFSKIGYAHALRTWDDFQKSPEPTKKK